MQHFEPQLQILPPAQRAVWDSLRSMWQQGYVLYGGTAIALRLGHRQSIDFDFFTDRQLARAALVREAPLIASATVLQDQPDTLTVLVQPQPEQRPVKISFFSGLTFGRVADPEQTADGVLLVASIQDLFATKLKVMLQRIEPRDYVDIAALLRSGASLAHALASARTIFGSAFQPAEALKALVYFESQELATIEAEDRALLRGAASAVRDLPMVALRSRSLC